MTLRPKGDVVLDRGATEAVRAHGRSLLPVGVVGVRGSFRAGDAVRLISPDGDELGRGLARCSVADAARLAGRSTEELAADERTPEVLVHRDEMVMWK